MDTISASFDVLSKQAVWAAEDYLRGARKAIDEEFGAGYAQDHPELMGTFMRVCAMDMQTGVAGKIAQENADTIATALGEIAAQISSALVSD